MFPSDIPPVLCDSAYDSAAISHAELGCTITLVTLAYLYTCKAGRGGIYSLIEQLSNQSPLVRGGLMTLKETSAIIVPAKIVFEILKLDQYLPSMTLYFIGTAAFIYALDRAFFPTVEEALTLTQDTVPLSLQSRADRLQKKLEKLHAHTDAARIEKIRHKIALNKDHQARLQPSLSTLEKQPRDVSPRQPRLADLSPLM